MLETSLKRGYLAMVLFTFSTLPKILALLGLQTR